MHESVDQNEHKSNTSSSPSINLSREILTSSVASLIHQGFVSLEEIGQDGMRVRAAAGSSSFRRQPTLENLHDEAKKHLEELDGQRQNSDDEDDASKPRTRSKAAVERAAREREARIARAIAEGEKLREKKRAEEDKSSGVMACLSVQSIAHG